MKTHLYFVSQNNPPHNISLEETTSQVDKVLSLNGRDYKILGDKEEISYLKSHLATLKTDQFKDLPSFEATFNELDRQGKASSAFQNVIVRKGNLTIAPTVSTVVDEIILCKGAKHEIKKALAHIPSEKQNVDFLMEIATNLANQGKSVDACHVFYFIQVNFKGDEGVKHFLKIGKCFMDYGINKKDIKALDFAEFHLNIVKNRGSQGFRNTVNEDIHKIIVCLEHLSSQGEEKTQFQARDLLDTIKVNHLLENKSATSELEVQKLKDTDSEVREAFNIAEAHQKRVDDDNDPLIAPPGKIIRIDVEGKSVPIHVNITGERKRKEDPIVILESGLGCFSADWKVVQNQIPSNIQVISYDRAGMGWSGIGDTPTVERTILYLEMLLKSCALEPPYLFVGHSYGGFIGQLFALMHPDQVKGMILVDSAIEDMIPNQSENPLTIDDFLPPSVLSGYPSSDRGHFFDEDTGLIVNRVAARSSHHITFKQELAQFPHTGELLQSQLSEIRNQPPFSFPIKVIASGQQNFEENKRLNEKEKEHWNKWQKSQQKLVDRSDEGELIIAKSDHMIMYHAPETIIEQIQTWF